MTRLQGRAVSVTVHAPAKLNLDLRVIGRRRDGYHELRTILQSVSLHDTLTLTRRSGPMIVRCRTASMPRDEANLVWKTAQVLWTGLGGLGAPHGVAISIAKRIPMAGGLGGGSSDAASALRALSVLWDVALSRAHLRELGARVGSDVPYFLEGGLAVGAGRGTRLRRLADLHPYWIVLAFPRFGVQTSTAYQWFDVSVKKPIQSLPRDWRHRFGVLRNDLEGPVVAHHPDIGVMVDRLQSGGALHAAMSGSGSTVFGLYRRQADAIAARRSARRQGWRTVLSRTVNHDEFNGLTAVARRR